MTPDNPSISDIDHNSMRRFRIVLTWIAILTGAALILCLIFHSEALFLPFFVMYTFFIFAMILLVFATFESNAWRRDQ
jgi:fatty acid desaturase